ncbi:MAG: hypothetical protein R3314_11705 [Longimicrobiales bacterium]|nr:hypothetical protein [Longimicrobiales bacterium]
MTLTLMLRLIHIILGVFWAGVIFFLVLFLGPAVRRSGPGGGRVMAEINRARFFEVMPVVALVTILSGAWLLWLLSGGFEAAFMGTPWGISLSVGAVAAVVAFVIGVFVMRPATTRMLELGPMMAAASSDEERQAIGAELAPLRKRSRTASLWVAWLLLIVVATMAVARYV